VSVSESEADTVLNDAAGGLKRRELRQLFAAVPRTGSNRCQQADEPTCRTTDQSDRPDRRRFDRRLNILSADFGPGQSVVICKSETEICKCTGSPESAGHADRRCGWSR